MIVLDASVALEWFVDGEPRVDAARQVLQEIGREPSQFAVPDLFVEEILAVLCRRPGATVAQMREALALVDKLGMARLRGGHELLSTAARYAVEWRVSGYDAIYVATAALVGGTWLTADARAARRVKHRGLARVLGS